MALIEMVVYPLINLIYLYIIHSYFRAYFVQMKTKRIKYYPLVLVLYYLAAQSSFSLVQNQQVTLLVNILGMLAVTFFYESKPLSKLISIVILFIIGFAVESLTIISYSALFSTSFEAIKNTPSAMLLLVLISKLVCVILVKIFQPLLNYARKESNAHLSLTYWIIVFIIPSISVFIIYVLLEFSSGKTLNWLTGTAIALILLANILFFCLYDYLLDNAAAEKENVLLHQQITLFNQHYLEMELSQKEIRFLRHDMKHRLLPLLTILERANFSEKDEALDKLQKILGKLQSGALQIYSGVAVIDTILSYKAAYAAKFGIRFHPIVINLPESFYYDFEPIAVILGNALDNAIEACKQIAEEKPKIKIVIAEEGGNLFLLFSNPFRGTVKIGEDGLPTTIKNATNHGLGTKSIKRVVEELGGYLNATAENQIFTLEILLHGKN